MDPVVEVGLADGVEVVLASSALLRRQSRVEWAAVARACSHDRSNRRVRKVRASFSFCSTLRNGKGSIHDNSSVSGGDI